MLEYDRTDVSEGININTIGNLNDCTVFHYWYFLTVYDGCKMTQKFMSFNDVVIVTVGRK